MLDKLSIIELFTAFILLTVVVCSPLKNYAFPTQCPAESPPEGFPADWEMRQLSDGAIKIEAEDNLKVTIYEATGSALMGTVSTVQSLSCEYSRDGTSYLTLNLKSVEGHHLDSFASNFKLSTNPTLPTLPTILSLSCTAKAGFANQCIWEIGEKHFLLSES